MTIEFEDESGIALGIDAYGVAAEVIACALDYMECPYEAQVNVLLVDDEEIRVLNRKHRRADRPTDVLSFPMVEYPAPGQFDFLEEDGGCCFEPDSGELMLGDIVISAARVLAQADEYGHSVKREFAFLVAHSMLHLMGYDHMTGEESAVMERLQEEILGQLGISR